MVAVKPFHPPGVPPALLDACETLSAAMALRKKKIALKPGFSLMDWNRLCSKATKLNGLNGVPKPKDGWTKAEVKKHKSKYDGWMIIRGEVYNVTPYLPYHPGGDQIMLQLLGKDATKDFDKNHDYVSLHMLEACHVGTLKVHGKPVDNDDDDVVEEEDEKCSSSKKATGGQRTFTLDDLENGF